MLRIPGKIPIAISPFFWLTAALIGWINSMGSGSPFLLTLIWVFVIFISILVHEFGHALTSRFFGQTPRVELVAFGGVTYQEGNRLRGWREFIVILNGPLFGFVLFLFTLMLLNTGWFKSPVTLAMLQIFVWVNLFWTIVNLLPVMPLDGGQLVRVICESISKGNGLKYALFFSMLFSALLACFFFFIGYFLIGAIFFLFTFQNFATWRRVRVMTDQDQNDDLTHELKEIEDLLAKDHKAAALPRLEEIRQRAKRGLIFNLTTQYLASFRAEEGNFQEVYHLLSPIKKHLSPESTIHLHRAAYEMKDYPLVMELSGTTFQYFPDPDVALYNAEASAVLKQVEPAIGWLKAARKCGINNLKTIIEKEAFTSIREIPEFRDFWNSL